MGGKRRLKKIEQGWGRVIRLGMGISKHPVVRAYFMGQIGCLLSNV